MNPSNVQLFLVNKKVVPKMIVIDKSSGDPGRNNTRRSHNETIGELYEKALKNYKIT